MSEFDGLWKHKPYVSLVARLCRSWLSPRETTRISHVRNSNGTILLFKKIIKTSDHASGTIPLSYIPQIILIRTTDYTCLNSDTCLCPITGNELPQFENCCCKNLSPQSTRLLICRSRCRAANRFAAAKVQFYRQL